MVHAFKLKVNVIVHRFDNGVTDHQRKRDNQNQPNH